MNFCLGFQFLNEAEWLRLHLSVILDAASIDGVVAVDGGSTDGSADVVRDLCARYDRPLTMEMHPWAWDFAAQQNHVVELAEREGYDAYFKWDPDELMWPSHINEIAGYFRMKRHKVVITPRYNFSRDRTHYCPYLWPDKQLRFVVLHEGFRWRERLHASTNAYDLWRELPNETSPRFDLEREIVFIPHMPIYHYEGIKPLPERSLKWLNYDRIRKGEEPLSELPPDYPIPHYPLRATIVFNDPQPLNPALIGARAPYGE